MTRFLFTAILTSALSVSVFAQVDGNQGPAAYDAEKTIQVSQEAVGKQLRDFELTDINGNPVHLA